jgi:hypothetical protein
MEGMDEVSRLRRLMYMQPERLMKVERPRVMWSDEVGKEKQMQGCWN